MNHREDGFGITNSYPEVFRVWKFHKIHRKTSVSESLFNKVDSKSYLKRGSVTGVFL